MPTYHEHLQGAAPIELALRAFVAQHKGMGVQALHARLYLLWRHVQAARLLGQLVEGETGVEGNEKVETQVLGGHRLLQPRLERRAVGNRPDQRLMGG
mgnify:CR=1 FL=1